MNRDHLLLQAVLFYFFELLVFFFIIQGEKNDNLLIEFVFLKGFLGIVMARFFVAFSHTIKIFHQLVG